jgi:hypothetical protein
MFFRIILRLLAFKVKKISTNYYLKKIKYLENYISTLFFMDTITLHVILEIIL